MALARPRRPPLALLILPLVALAVLLGVLALALVVSWVSGGAACPAVPVDGPAAITLGPSGTGRLVGATEYGGPGDPSSGVVGASGMNLLAHPDSYAELGGLTFATATRLGGLPYMTPLRITWGPRSVIAYKRDFGFGGGPILGLPRVIDLWWQLAGRLGIPYEGGRWSGPVRVERPPQTGAGNVLEQTAVPVAASAAISGAISGGPTVSDGAAAAGGGAGCPAASAAGVPLTPGPRATLLPGGLAAAPAGAPLAVKEIIAAGNEIAGRPYVYGGGHGLPLSELSPVYDCSSSVEHLLYGARLLPVTDGEASSGLEAFGAPGPGTWVTLYANPDHVFMYVAGLRWDTWNAAGAGDGSSGIGWHPLIRSSAGFVARHPEGL